jgi:O-acetylserine/cysteine efflux transporter
MKKLDILIAIFVAFCWGSNYVAAKFNLSEVPSFLSLSLRFIITSLILLPFVPRPKINFIDLYSISIVFGIFYVGLVYYGISLGAGASLAVILMQLSAPLSVIIAKIVLKEEFKLNAIIGMILAFVGVIIVVGNPNVTGGNILAIITLLFAAIFNAIYNIQSRKLKAVSPLSLLCYTSLIASPHLLLISYFLEGNQLELLQNSTITFWSSLLYSTIIAGILGVTGWIYLLQQYPVYKVMPFGLLVPIFGVFFSNLLLEESLTWHLFIGGVLTIIGVYISQVKPISITKAIK